MALLDKDGRPIEAGPTAPLERLFDHRDKIFEGIVNTKFYGDAAEASGRCAHCNGYVEVFYRFSDREKNMYSTDEQARQDLMKYMFSEMQRRHQCAVIFDGKDNIEDFLNKRFH